MSLADFHDPTDSNSSTWMVSARMNPRSKSEWIVPAACGAELPARTVQARVSFSPVVKNVTRPSRSYAARIKPVEPGLTEPHLVEKELAVVRLHLQQLGLERAANRYDGLTVLELSCIGGYRLAQRSRPLVLSVRQVGLPHVRHVQHGLGREELEALQDRQVVLGHVRRAYRLSRLERSERLLEHSLLADRILLAGLGLLVDLVQATLDGVEVRQSQLGLDDIPIARRIDVAKHVRDVLVIEAAQHVGDRIDLANIAQKLVAQSLTLGRALDKTRDVNELDHRRNSSLRLGQLVDPIEADVGDFDRADVRLDGAERIILRRGPRSGQGVEERRLPDVRKADDSDLEHDCTGSMGRRRRATAGQ